MPKQEINLSTSHWTIGTGIEKNKKGTLVVIDIDSTYTMVLSRKDVEILATALLRVSLDQETAQVETPKNPRKLGDLPEYVALKKAAADTAGIRSDYAYAWSRGANEGDLAMLSDAIIRTELADHKALHALLDAASDLL